MVARSGLTLLCAAAALAAAPPTFHRDVEPILQRRCQGCHRPGEIGPFPLLTYADARPRARAIREALLKRTMPPWFAAKASHPFANDPTLSPPEREALLAWTNTGAARGNPDDAPPPVTFTQGWNIPPPEATFDTLTDFNVPAQGALDYMHFVIPTGFDRDRWVEAVEVRPSYRAAVHHAVVYLRPPGSAWLAHVKPGRPGAAHRNGPGQGRAEVLTVYAPGMTPDRWPEGAAKLLPKGWDIILQLHYTTTGVAGRDRTRIGLRFARAPVTHRVVTMSMRNLALNIPPGEPNYRAEGRGFLPEHAEILSFFPHMHLRGKAFEYRAIHPDGTSEVLLRVEPYRFHWQLAYRLATPLALPAGTRLECSAWYDNSPNNPDNPDPSATVRWGEQSWDEMLAGFFDLRYPAQLTLEELFGQPVTRP